MKKIKKHSVGPKTVTPLQQLWESTPEAYHKYLTAALSLAQKQSQDEICIALVAYVRFGIRREFAEPFKQMVFGLCIGILEGGTLPPP